MRWKKSNECASTLPPNPPSPPSVRHSPSRSVPNSCVPLN